MKRMNIIYKTIQTPKGYYVYDRNRNAILGISKEEYDELEDIRKGALSEEDSKVINKYQKSGYLQQNRLKRIENPATATFEHYLTHHIKQMTLQVTQRCNLRCEYCVYSGKYKNRVHSDTDMDINLALKAIDFYVRSSEELDTLTLAFYGGEPLLKFDLIKQCVAYIKEKVIGKNISFVITTNGTLLSGEIVTFLEKNKFSVTISLDGSRDEHNIYRKFQNGQGSFDVIMNNLKNIKLNHPDLYKRIAFNTVINPRHNYANIKEYLEKDDIAGDVPVMLSLVESQELGTEVQFSEQFKLIRSFDYLKLLFNMLGKLDENYVSKLVINGKASTYYRYEQIMKKIPISEVGHHGGPCIPGAKRMFVNVKGNIYPCERVSETSGEMRIGSINEGFDINKVEKLLNVGKLTEDLCLKCWALLHCDICAKKADGKNGLSREVKCLSCDRSRTEALVNLKELCVLKELGCAFEDN